ncbi:MAG: hypothetical protein FWG92_05150 [Leptospirales bacterium]|nr:hypothetical protein [Leptospirales bacterium]
MKNFIKKMTASALAVMIFFLSSCYTSQIISFPTDLNTYIGENDIEASREYVLFAKGIDRASMYNAKNDISYLMDLGLIEHYYGNYAESSELLLEAERLIWEAYTKSVSEGFKAFGLMNPYQAEYPGEDFENVYVNIFSALNFYHTGDLEKALIEVRKVNEKLQYMNTEYENDYRKQMARQNNTLSGKIEYYTNSALARYLGVLFWRAADNMDSARIDAIGLNEAFAAAPHLYRHPVPPEMVMRGETCDELSIPAGMARLNFLSFTGLSPLKTHLSSGSGIEDNRVGLVLRQAQADRIEVVFDSRQRVTLSLLEPLDVITQQMFETREKYRQAVWFIREYTSVYSTALLSAATLGIYRGKSDTRKNTGLDLRQSQLMPGKAYVGAVNLTPGTYSFTINYYSGNNLIDSRRIENQTVTAGGINLIQDYCLKFDESQTGWHD